MIKTTGHNANNIALADLISDDADGDGGPDWQNAEAAEVESEFWMLQTNTGANAAKEELIGKGDDMGDGSETVTRRYEFYKYAAAPNTIDEENGEAMCDEVNPTTDLTDPMYLHGIGTDIEVAEAGGGKHTVNCEAQVVVGDYIGAQMAGFDAAMPLGLIDNLQDGELFVDYVPRTVVVGGNSPYTILLTSGSLPTGLTLDDYTDPASGDTAPGVLFGTPSAAGIFNFTVQATDANGDVVSKAYTLNVAGGVVQYQLTVSMDGSGSGTVTGNGIDCGVTCDVLLDDGTAVSLSAAPASDSVFTGWSGDCSGTGTCDTTMSADQNVTATFALQQYSLTVSKAGSGTGTVTGNGIDCGATCGVSLDTGTLVSLTATPAIGSVFTGWSGDCSGTGTCDTTMSAARNVTATFALQQYSLTVSKAGSGTGTVTGNGINCGATCGVSLNTGTAVSLTAAPASGSVFTGWSGDCSGTGTCDTTMSAARSVTATFVLATQQYTLTVTHIGSGTVTSSPKGINCGKQCSHAYKLNTSVTLTAKPKNKHLFLGWSGACSGTNLSCTVPITGNTTVNAMFD